MAVGCTGRSLLRGKPLCAEARGSSSGGRCAYSTAPALYAYTHLRPQVQLAPTGPHHHHDKPGVVAGELYPYTLSRIRRLASGLPPEGQLPTSGAFEMVEIPDSNLEL